MNQHCACSNCFIYFLHFVIQIHFVLLLFNPLRNKNCIFMHTNKCVHIHTHLTHSLTHSHTHLNPHAITKSMQENANV